MHVPICETKNIDIKGFYEHLSEEENANVDYDKRKWLFIPSYYTEYRYILGTTGKKPLICVGINPSTARPDNLDNTLKSVERIAHYNEYDSFIMFNVYAQRATDPKLMDKELNQRLHEENMKAFEYILSKSPDFSPAIWAAWGNIINQRKYLLTCLEDMVKIGKKYNALWFTSGKISKSGNPHHPLYLKKTSPLDKFDVNAYIESKKL